MSSIKKTLTRKHVKAARGLLEVSQEDLARWTGISIRTIQNFETGIHKPKPETVSAITQALEERGIVWTNGDTPSVTLDLSKAKVCT